MSQNKGPYATPRSRSNQASEAAPEGADLCRCCGFTRRSLKRISEELLILAQADLGQDGATVIYLRHVTQELGRELSGLCPCCSRVSPEDRRTPRCERCVLREARGACAPSEVEAGG